ncbi:flagellar hook-length control protein FliK [Piscinibacter sp.]|uniref:flagellar hook-length control protein FliK n=1 Tax=Piscinibacter sp. TaxID=1903157 RepID=UPI003559589C
MGVTMLVNTQALPVTPAPGGPTNAGSATPGSAPAGDEHPFAKLLSAHQAQHGTPRQPAGKAAAKAADVGKDKAASLATARAPAPTDAVARSDPATRAAKDVLVDMPTDTQLPEVAAHDTEPDDAKDAAATAAPSGDANVAMDPALAEWLASLNRPVEPPRAEAAASTDTPRTAAKTQPIAGAADMPAGLPVDAAKAPPSGCDTADAPQAHASERGAKAIELADRSAPNKHDSLPIAAVKQQDEAARPLERLQPVDLAAPSPATAPTPANALAALAASPRTEHGGGAVTTLDVPTPVAAPEFRSALGVQVSVLARDGVQHAQLNLNPAEMGPISVQIALDGTQAQVDFGADSATTRQVIESGLPELAAALRDAGLTLSGGGVSQHSKGRSHGDGGERGQSGSTRADSNAAERDAVTVRRTGWRVPQGAVDTYA